MEHFAKQNIVTTSFIERKNKQMNCLSHNRRTGAREGKVQVNHRRFGPDFLRTLGVLEKISTTLLCSLLLLLFNLGWTSIVETYLFLYQLLYILLGPVSLHFGVAFLILLPNTTP